MCAAQIGDKSANWVKTEIPQQKVSRTERSATPPDKAIRENNLCLVLWLRVSALCSPNAEIKCDDKKLLPGVKM